jgi:elongation factor G
MGSALKNKGVQHLLDGVCDYLPAPTEVKNFGFDLATPEHDKVNVECDFSKEFIGYAFKLDETKFGQLTYMRVYQGIIRK